MGQPNDVWLVKKTSPILRGRTCILVLCPFDVITAVYVVPSMPKEVISVSGDRHRKIPRWVKGLAKR